MQTVLIATVIMLFLININTSLCNPPVYWEASKINAVVMRGGQTEVMATLKAVSKLGNVYLRITPGIKPYVDVSPSILCISLGWTVDFSYVITL